MKQAIFDIEGDGLVPNRIHCLSVNLNGKSKSTTSYDNMRKFFTTTDVIIGHNIVLFDIPVVERILNIKVEARVVDTLALSWYLYPKRNKHGLAEWGEEFGVPKPLIDDWDNLEIEEYIHRCSEDVRINTILWEKIFRYLMKLYDQKEEEVWKLIDYLTFKMQTVAMQERNKWRLDVPFVEEKLVVLEKQQFDKVEELKAAMPLVDKYVTKTRPAKPFKKDGTHSSHGEKWFQLLKEKNLPITFNGEIKVLHHQEEPKPSSPVQIKDWLFSLGWTPTTFKFVRDKETGDTREIPQVQGREGEVCDSVKDLFDKEPSLEVLNGLSILNHRIGLLKGFLRDQEGGYLKASVGGFTNTLRLKHREIVNLPGVDKAFGEWIRGALIAPEGYELCGSDMAALEDRTKQHYMLPYDPDYVDEMMKPGFCPHVDIAVQAGFLSEEQKERYRTQKFLSKDDEKEILAGRKAAKPVNYGGVYGQKPPGLSRSANIPIKKAEELYKIYWERNWSVIKIAEEQKVKEIDGQKWLFNPVSKFWYSLRHEKDRFSTLNQGTGAYCFDMWIKHILKKRPQITAQFHDEGVFCIKKGFREDAVKLIQEAIESVNEELKLNRRLDVEVQFGDTYAQIH